MALVRSPLLQGAALDALQAFFAALAASATPSASAEALLPRLLAAGAGRDAGRQAQRSVAQCVAVLACAAAETKVSETVTRLLGDLGQGGKAGAAGAGGERLALLCLGEIGRRTDLSSMPQVSLSTRGWQVILNCMGSLNPCPRLVNKGWQVVSNCMGSLNPCPS